MRTPRGLLVALVTLAVSADIIAYSVAVPVLPDIGRRLGASPGTIGPLRPSRSDIAPIGTDTVSSVTPNDANSNPIIVGDAPSFRLKSGSTGIAIE